MSILDNHRFFGKANLVASFNKYLVDTVPGGYVGIPALPVNKEFYWYFDYPIAPINTPSISVAEIGLFNYGEIAMDRLLAYVDGVPVYGTKNQTLLEITCMDQDKADYTQATLVVRNLRDRIADALIDAQIPLVDYNNPLKPVIGYIWLDSAGNAINEKYIVDSQNQQFKRYVLMVRIFWFELEQISNTKTIVSNTTIV
jgi:hypothetical protein